MDKVLSAQLLTHGTDVPGSKLSKVPLIMLYFGACWSSQSKDLNPFLVMAYNQANRDGKLLEVVYVSMDATDNQFREHFREMPWLAVSRRNMNIIEELRNQYFTESIPELVLVNSKGEVLKKNCSQDVIQNGARWLRPYLIKNC